MSDYRNRTFAEIAFDETESTTRTLTVTDVDALAQYLAGAEPAGIVLGARVAVALTSRAGSVRSRLASTALLKLVARHRRSAPTKSQN